SELYKVLIVQAQHRYIPLFGLVDHRLCGGAVGRLLQYAAQLHHLCLVIERIAIGEMLCQSDGYLARSESYLLFYIRIDDIVETGPACGAALSISYLSTNNTL